MATCRACGTAIGELDDVVTVADSTMHASCVEPAKGTKQRRIGMWAAMGSRGQMLMSDVQRDTPME
jgi:hypothetical protein